MDKIINILLLIIIFVFDPLAISLVVAANFAFAQAFPKKEEEIDNFFNVLYGGHNENRVYIHAHLGMNDVDSVFSKLRFMAMGLECKWIVFDHLHMLLSMTTDGDERRNIDAIMHNFRTLVEETGVGLILVSHLRRVDGNRGH